MSWALLGLLVVGLALALAVLVHRRAQLRDLESVLSERDDAKRRGSDKARLQHPAVDLTNCIGCGLCVTACPEEGVLQMAHGQATVVHGARCVGHGLCADACPTAAIAVTLGDLSQRRDIPAISESLEAKGVPGLFLAGEVTGYALIRTAISHGTAVADEVARRRSAGTHDGEALDLLIVGAGPAGIACALRAKELGMRFLVVEQEELGGTVAKYPRRKLVMTQPVVLPLHGRLTRTTYRKEELMELWRDIVLRHDLPIRTGVAYRGVEPAAGGGHVVQTSVGPLRARNVCVAIGRRGSPRKLDVPGEQLPKVAYHLVDAASYQQRRVLVVGGGDSAVEAAVGLAEQPGNHVTLSYRKAHFSRVKARNERNLDMAEADGRLRVVRESAVVGITGDTVQLRIASSGGEARDEVVPNDDVFVMAGGVPPFQLLEDSGVSFDPADRDAPTPVVEQGTGLLRALVASLVLALGAGGFALWHRAYYALPADGRAALPEHAWLRSAGGLGLLAGLLASSLIVVNLCYLVRRGRFGARLPGSLRAWMTSHLVTGVLAFLFVLVHAGFAPRGSSGGRAFIALTVVVAAGALGRYVYSFVPRAANGRVMELDEVRAQLASLSGEWDRAGRGEFGAVVRNEVEALASTAAWRTGLPRRLAALLLGQRRLGAKLARLRAAGVAEGVSADTLERLMVLARRAHRTSLMATHHEDLRALTASWRYLHRWLALLMVILAGLHVTTAVRYAELRWSDLWPAADSSGLPEVRRP